MKSSPQSIRPSILRITRPTLREILLILFNQNLLSSNRIIHLRFDMRRKHVEEIVKDASGDEGVNVSNGEQVLPTNRNTGGGAAGFLNIVHEARKRGDTTEEECDDCAPVGTEFGRVSVDAVEIVHVGDGDVGFSYEEIAGARVSGLFFWKERQKFVVYVLSDEYRGHWAEEDGISSEESDEFRSRCEDFPRDESPASNHSGNQLTTTNVDVFGPKGHEIVGGRDGICCV